MTVTHTTYSLVIGDADPERLKAYLYDHTVLLSSTNVGRQTAYVLATTVTSPDSAIIRAEYLVHYQCDRLASGLYGVRLTGGTLTEALNELRHWAHDRIDVLTASVR